MFENLNNNLNNSFNNNLNILMNSYINDNDSISLDNYQCSQTNHKLEIVKQEQFQICLKKNRELFSKNKFNNSSMVLSSLIKTVSIYSAFLSKTIFIFFP